jgi:hypothetical protein
MACQRAFLRAAPSADEDDNPNEDAVAWCDSQIQEVRAVLEGLRNSHGCWCHATEEYEFRPPFVCGEQCQRARALMEKLELK